MSARALHRRPPRHSAPPDPARFTAGFSHRNANLYCEGVSAEEIASRAGTPCYVYSRDAMERAWSALDAALAGVPHSICYAVKANSTLGVLRVFERLGSSFDIVSGGELYRLRRVGVRGDRIVFSGVGKSRAEIREALGARIRLFNVESPAELELLASEAARLKRRAPAAIRINPDVEAGGHPHISTGHHRHKFGVDWAEARRLYHAFRGSRWIEWQGISAHIGSQILSVAPFRREVARLAEYFRELRGAGIALTYVDCGGGLGVRYLDEKPPAVDEYAREILGIVRALGCHLLLEPGRWLVGPAGILLTRVLYTKRNRGKTFVIVDAAMNDFMRPVLYGATHAITPARRRERKTTRVDIVGPVCETGDCFVRDWPLAEVNSGDLLAIWGTGAYGSVEASNYNSRPRPAEILVDARRFRVIRRRESRQDLIRGE